MLEAICKRCHRVFVIRPLEYESLKERKRSLPRYCPICQRAYKKEKEAAKKQREDLERQKRKAADAKVYQERLTDLAKEVDIVPLENIAPGPEDRPLYIIGNGFDLMHGVHSSYYDFGNTLGKHSNLRSTLETYLMADDLWADFEGALAKLNVEMMSQPFILDNFLDTMGAYEDDASAADFFVAAEMAAEPARVIAVDLMERFAKWIRSLEVPTKDLPLAGIIGTGKVLNFNYTDFIENLYGVPEKDICYIHGCRRKRKGKPLERLILGHLPNAGDVQFDFKDDWSGVNTSGNRAQMIYDAQEITLREIAEADNDLTKHCDIIIDEHKDFFESLSDINKVITIGHSLYPVDWDYFAEVIRQNSDWNGINWYFGCFGNGDLNRIRSFAGNFSIQKQKIHIFRTDTIRVNVPVKEPIRNTKIEQDKFLGSSESGHWNVYNCGSVVELRDASGDAMLERVFRSPMNGAVFADENTCFLVMRGVDAGVFLLRRLGGAWKYLGELIGIPNQGLITKRLRKILMHEEKAWFIYNSRVRVYDLTNGAMIFNKSVQQAPSKEYQGKDLTGEFRKIYKMGFY